MPKMSYVTKYSATYTNLYWHTACDYDIQSRFLEKYYDS